MPRELIDTRGRRGRLGAALHLRHDSHSPRHERLHRLNHDLLTILQARLPNGVFRRVQDALNAQDIALRGACDQLEDCKDDLAQAQRELFLSRRDNTVLWDDSDWKDEQLAHLAAKHAEDQSRLRDLHAENVLNDNRLEAYGLLFDFGSTRFAEKNQEAEDLRAELASLRETLTQNDETISSLNTWLLDMSMAAPDKQTQLAMEWQATRNLTHVQGLNNDIAQRDADLVRANDRIKTLTTSNIRLQTEANEAGKRIKDLVDAVEEANKQATGQGNVVEEQKTMKKLMDTNARLPV